MSAFWSSDEGGKEMRNHFLKRSNAKKVGGTDLVVVRTHRVFLYLCVGYFSYPVDTEEKRAIIDVSIYFCTSGH